jgi:hypothetical protein
MSLSRTRFACLITHCGQQDFHVLDSKHSGGNELAGILQEKSLQNIAPAGSCLQGIIKQSPHVRKLLIKRGWTFAFCLKLIQQYYELIKLEFPQLATAAF